MGIAQRKRTKLVKMIETVQTGIDKIAMLKHQWISGVLRVLRVLISFRQKKRLIIYYNQALTEALGS